MVVCLTEEAFTHSQFAFHSHTGINYLDSGVSRSPEAGACVAEKGRSDVGNPSLGTMSVHNEKP